MAVAGVHSITQGIRSQEPQQNNAKLMRNDTELLAKSPQSSNSYTKTLDYEQGHLHPAERLGGSAEYRRVSSNP
jgi:hypothetical protein